MSFFARLMPQSLARRLILLLLVALAVVQSLSYAMFVRDRRDELRRVGLDNVVTRTVSLVRLINESPKSLHAALLRTAGSRRLRYQLSEKSGVAEPTSTALSRKVEEDVRFQLGESVSEVLVRVSEPAYRPFQRPRLRRWFHGEDDDEGSEAREHHENRRPWRRRWRGPRVPFVDISVKLPDGQWLNAKSSVPPRLSRWPKPFRLQFLFMALAIAGIVVLSIRYLTRPLKTLGEAADRLGRGEEVGELPEEGASEVRNTTRAFNTMQQRLSRFVNDRTAMLAAISHDLRTPITSLRLRAEFVEDPETREKMFATLDEMQEMTDAVLGFVREDFAAEETHLTDLSALASSVCADFSDTGRDVVCREPMRKVQYVCRPQSLKRALRNVVDNAVAYGGRAEVSLEVETDGQVAIVVRDHGPGIPDGQMEEVFKPFTRLEGSRSRETGGTGLGLAIARSILRNHGGDIELSNHPEGGLEVRLVLPRGSRES